MIGTSSRLLHLLSLLSSRPSWTADELARRMDVTDRTVRRDITRLRELGYDVESDPGRWGGYRLRPGTKQIPLVLDDEESLAVTVALREAARTGVLGDDQAVLSAFLKLRQLLPTRVASQLGAMDDVFEHTARAGGQPLSPGLLAGLASACRRGERVRLSYRDSRGTETERAVDPHRLVFTGNRWYLVARDVERAAWRTFRADRVVHAEPTGRVVPVDDPPDAARFVAEMLTSDYPLYVTVRLFVPLAEAMRAVPPTAGVHRADGPDATVVELGGTDVESLAARLVKLGVPLTVLEPAEVRAAVRRRGLALADGNRPDDH
ncbi:helix-turn-helix transcriptional regulator [Amycolatopsis jiangsuensis]|uniref:Putative DNA-binding transcriptional regulator YafY n=1 Tax=Amycolatopsis jiangsuensis TaxID=1181879 RepID=A0A840IXV3_9PSEU|nr:YafY family protein [Amycolatopsis jiangsuensis]MBB4686339.1 putative DNA-binding transcriptional regulator YafY [Amycolatopsis jiangsuensis]